jgi:RsiW-degrading membrane proteinase PrsW (M82 family)
MEGVAESQASSARDRGDWLSSRPWLLILLAGVAVLIGSAVITAVTRDTILVPEMILVGSFLAPVATLAFAMTREHEGHIDSETIVLGFLISGTLGLTLAALLETYLLPKANGTFLTVGLIEEACKGAVVVMIAHFWVRTRAPRDGMILGAVVGAGFAAFESSGYAFQTLISNAKNHPVLHIFQTEAVRALYSPFAHITWTALFGGALFYAAQGERRFRLTGNLFWTFVGIVVLHGCWDASYGIAIQLTKGLLGEGWSFSLPNTASWVGSPTGNDLKVWSLISNALLIANALVGLSWLVHRYRLYGRRDQQLASRSF